MRRYLSRKKTLLASAVLMTASALTLASTRMGDLFSFSSEKEDMGVVRRTDLLQQVTVAGTVVPMRRTLFTPSYSGYVSRLFVHLGEHVKEGMPVVTITQTVHGTNEEPHPMRAPFPGTVVQVLHTEGEFVEAGKDGNGIVRIDDLTRLFVNSDVPEADIAKIREGQDVVIKANAILSHPYRGIIREIALASKEKKEWSRSGDRVEFDVRIEVMDKDDELRPGMSANVDIITDKRTNVLALPHEYIQKENGKYFVTLDKGQKREIQVGMQNEEMFEITRGLKENDQVRVVDFFTLPKE